MMFDRTYVQRIEEDFDTDRYTNRVRVVELLNVDYIPRPMDRDRAADGIDYRLDCAFDGVGVSADEKKPCRVMEMLCGLALRVGDALEGMELGSTGSGVFFTKADALEMFLNNGLSDLFALNDVIDVEGVSIWDQFQIWLHTMMED